jgi:hypothetical protein
VIVKGIKVFILTTLFSVFICSGQEVEIIGKVISDDNVENVHVLNKTSKHFTITNSEGKFKMNVKLKDTLTFISLQHIQKKVIINQGIIETKKLTVLLQERINELNEVVLGKILTGDLGSDVKTFEEEPQLNFYDVGIPGYKGKPKTQSERRLNEATTGAGIVPLNPILNAISGRTKMLKKRIKLEAVDELLDRIISTLAEDFLSLYPLEPERQMDFFYFCSEDINFQTRCKDKSDVEIFEYLKEKYDQYQVNLSLQKN